MIRRLLLAAAGLVMAPSLAAGQFPSDDVVDRLVAIVGDSTVLQTQIVEEIQRLELNGTAVPAPTDPAYDALFRSVLDGVVNRLLVLQAAAKDSLIQVDDATIDERVAGQIDQLAQQFGGQPALQAALAQEGLTLAQYREIMRNDARMNQIQQLFYQLRLRGATPAQVSEAEMLERFQEARTTLQQRPKLVTFRQVVIRPQASEEAKARAREEAEALLVRVQAGEDFAELAEEYSDDGGTAPLGGDLGWFRRGRMVRAFEEAAFLLMAGQVSPVVETPFGFHVIKVDRLRSGERQARHILIIPERTDDDVERARETAREVRRLAETGEPMADLFATYSDQEAPDSLSVPFEQISELPGAYSVLQTATTGEFIGPLEYDAGQGDSRIAVIEVVMVREAGAYTFEDLRPQIASQLQQQKQIERLVEELRAATHIEIRM